MNAAPRGAIVTFGVCALLMTQSASALRLTVGQLQWGNVTLRQVEIVAPPAPAATTAKIGVIDAAGVMWRDVAVRCDDFVFSAVRIACNKGKITAPFDATLRFAFDRRTSRAELLIEPNTGGRLEARGTSTPSIELDATITDFPLSTLSALAGDRLSPLTLTAGTLAGHATARYRSGALTAAGDVRMNGAAFTDPTGTHAAQGLALSMHFTAASESGLRSGAWSWMGDARWTTGELLWSPVYVRGEGQHLAVAGTFAQAAINVDRATLDWPGIGAAQGGGVIERESFDVASLALSARDIDAGTLSTVLLEPMLTGSSNADVSVQGKIDVELARMPDAPWIGSLAWRDGTFELPRAGIAIEGARLQLPFRSDRASAGAFDWSHAALGKLPLGAVHVPFDIGRIGLQELRIPAFELGLFGGSLRLANVVLSRRDGVLKGSMDGEITQLDLAQLTTSLGLPTLDGTLAATLPRLTYMDKKLTSDGAIGIDVFDGHVVVQDLAVEDLFGRTPRTTGTITGRDLDLEPMTRAFSFGRMLGKIDAEMRAFEFQGAVPVRFDASIKTSEGRFKKRISQRAVENIAALGGGGARAAIEGSFLRLFQDFGYSEIGLSCQLRDDVCVMDGISPTADGFVIVSPGGVPSLKVIGYNRQIEWSELLNRLKRIKDDNVRPVIE